MTDTPDPDRGAVGGPRLSDEDRALAAEYVLHLLGPDERSEFEARLGFSAALRAEVQVWEAHFADIAADEIKPVAPQPSAKPLLMRGLFPETARPSSGFWQRVGLWRGLTFAGFGAAAVLGGLLFTQPQMPAPLLVGEISAEDDSLRLLVLYDGADGTLRITRTDGVSPPGRVLELWAIPPDEAPVSLGLLDASAQGTTQIPPALRGAADELVLAISDEPPGGSPTGAPTGTVRAIGRLAGL
jgi:anti-sigma-K factor RskA